MLRHLGLILLLLAAGWLAASRAPAAVISVVDLGPGTVSATSVAFDVTLTFTGGAADTIESIQLSVFGSDPLLTAADTDFSRFSFAMDGTTLSGWVEFSPLSTGLGFYAPFDPITGPFLSPSATPYHLGVLTVDLTGLPGGTSVFVTLGGGPPGLDTDVGGTVDGGLVGTFSGAGAGVASVTFDDPEGVPLTTPTSLVVPEPSGLVLAGIGMGTLLGCAWRRRRTA